jgi:hypothetical protein
MHQHYLAALAAMVLVVLLRLSAPAAAAAASADSAPPAPTLAPRQQAVRMTLNILNNITADGRVTVRDAKGVRSDPVDVKVDVAVDGARQANATRGSSGDGRSRVSSSTSTTVELWPGSGADDCGKTPPAAAAPSTVTIILNIISRVYIDARRLVSGSSDVAVGPQAISVNLAVGNVTQLELGARAREGAAAGAGAAGANGAVAALGGSPEDVLQRLATAAVGAALDAAARNGTANAARGCRRALRTRRRA